MFLKLSKPTSPGLRHTIKLKQTLAQKPVLKTKVKNIKNNAGKNNENKITIRHKGGGHQKKYRIINFNNDSFIGIVFSLEYDPNRTSNIASIYNFKTGSFFYILAAKDLKIGTIVKSGVEGDKKLSHTLVLEKIPVGCCVFNISIRSSDIGRFSRSAGCYSVIIEKTKTKVKILLSSGKFKNLPLNCFGTIGIVSNSLNFLTQIGKAGRSRWLNKRPKVRGVAMNPVDHPNGGGEGKSSGKRKTAWGTIIRSAK